MPKPMRVIEEFHITMTVRGDLPQADVVAVRATLASRRFRDHLRKVIRFTAGQYKSLRPVRLTLSC